MRIAALFFTVLVGVSASTEAHSRALTVHPTSSIALAGPFGRLVADGRRAAAVGPCGIMLWTVGARKAAFVQPCRATRQIDAYGVDEVALAGDRIAWMREESISHGMRVQTELVVKTGRRKPRQIASAYNDSGYGSYLLTLAGDGNTLAFAWEYSFDEDQQEQVYRISPTSGVGPCPFEPEGLLPNPPQTSFCANTGLPVGLVRGVSEGRILVSFGDSLGLVGPDNTVHDLPIPYIEGTDQVALYGGEIVLVHPGGTTLDVYDAASGSPTHRWPIPRAAHLGKLSVAGELAVYSARGIHLVNLRTGSRRTILAPGGKPPVAATIEPGGLYFLYRTKRGERLGYTRVKA